MKGFGHACGGRRARVRGQAGKRAGRQGLTGLAENGLEVAAEALGRRPCSAFQVSKAVAGPMQGQAKWRRAVQVPGDWGAASKTTMARRREKRGALTRQGCGAHTMRTHMGICAVTTPSLHITTVCQAGRVIKALEAHISCYSAELAVVPTR